MTTFTLYVTSADLTTLNAIFNGVAMICTQTAMIWGFATLAAMWSLFSGTAKTAVAAVQGNAAGVLPKAGLGAFLPFVLAIVLTSNALMGRVQVESTVTGAVTVIDNVPMALSVIPATASLLGHEVGASVETAFQGTGTSYSSISASGNGFINPLKVLLSARGAMNRLNGISSEIDSVVASCLGPGAAVDYANVNALINNAGNSGATASQSIAINGANPTALGAMLYQASLNTQGYVNSMNAANNTVLSCPDAANQAASDVGDALNSGEFSRVFQGAVNGMDDLSANTNVTFDQLTQQWNATRTANSVNNTIAIGSQQAMAETINMLAAEIVENEQACMATSGESRTICESALVQSNEIERNNIQLAAAEVPMLKYAGSFGNLLQALLIGVGPIVVMFMMFAGVEAGKCIKTVAHLMVWPIIVTNVGAEVINGLIYIDIANFVQGLVSSNGVLSQAQTFNMYKELSFQIGSASHMMASLPVIMGMVFALGESAALVNVGSNIAPKSSDVADGAAPKAVQQDALVKSSNMSSITHSPENATSTVNGAMPMIAASSTMGREIDKSDATFSSTDQMVKARAQNASVAESNAKIASKSNYSELGFSQAESEALRKATSASAGTRTSDSVGENAASESSNAVHSEAGVNGNVGVQGSAGVGGGGGVGGGIFGQLAASGGTGASARSALSDTQTGAHSDEAHRARETSNTLENALNYAKTHGFGTRATNELTKRVEAQRQYNESLTSSQSSSDLQSKALEQSADVTAYAGHVTTEQVAHQAHANADFGSYMMLEGHAMTGNAAYQRNMDLARSEADSSATSNVQGDSVGRDAALAFRSAQLTAQDTTASVSERYEAARFVTGALSHLMHGGVGHQAIAAPTQVEGSVTNATGSALPGEQHQAPAVRPTAHAPAHHAVHHQASAAQHASAQPAVPAAQQPPAPEVSAEAAAISVHSRGIIEYAHQQGLGGDQDGTIKRTAATVASAVRDFGHDKGSQTTYNYGEGGAAEHRQAQREAHEKAEATKALVESTKNAPELTPGD